MKNRIQGYPITEGSERYKAQPIEQMIMTIRGQRVIFDADLARIYGVSTRRLNEQVRRNADRFPPDFAFVLTREEVGDLKSQFATSSAVVNQSQFATSMKSLCHAKAPRPPRRMNSEKGSSQIFVVLCARRYLRPLRLCVRKGFDGRFDPLWGQFVS